MTRRYYKRWVNIFGDAELEDLIKIAEKYLIVSSAGKPGICCWWGFYLFGTKAEIMLVEKEWTATGARVFNRKPKGAWSITEKKVPKGAISSTMTKIQVKP